MFKLSFIVILAVIAFVVADEDESKATIVNYDNKGIDADGSFTYKFKTSNNIAQEESGVGAASVAGKASWTAKDGTPVEFSYIADENGYQPKGTFIPTIPPAIQKSIDFNIANAKAEQQTEKSA